MVPQNSKSVGWGSGGGGGRIPHFNWSVCRGDNFFFFFLEPGVKLDEKSIENGLEEIFGCVSFLGWLPPP